MWRGLEVSLCIDNEIVCSNSASNKPLFAIDAERVALLCGSRISAEEVRTTSWLSQSLTADLLSLEGWQQVLLLQLICSVLIDALANDAWQGVRTTKSNSKDTNLLDCRSFGSPSKPTTPVFLREP